jgi:hypothetical protein
MLRRRSSHTDCESLVGDIASWRRAIFNRSKTRRKMTYIRGRLWHRYVSGHDGERTTFVVMTIIVSLEAVNISR